MSYAENILAHWIERGVGVVRKNKKIALLVSGFVVVTIGGKIGYRWYDEQIQMTAHAAYVDFMKVMHAPIKLDLQQYSDNVFKTEDEKWARIAQKAAELYEQHRGAGIAPLFGLLQSEALLRLGKKDEALVVMEAHLGKVRNTALADLWRVKSSSIALESGDSAVADRARGALEVIIQDEKNSAHQYALYQLGEYYWYKQDFVQAKKYWQQLMVKHADASGDFNAEMFIEKVKSKLALVTAEG